MGRKEGLARRRESWITSGNNCPGDFLRGYLIRNSGTRLRLFAHVNGRSRGGTAPKWAPSGL